MKKNKADQENEQQVEPAVVKKRFARIKNRFKIINPRAWLGYDHLKSSTDALWNSVDSLFKPAVSDVHDDFDSAVNDLGLNELILRKKQQAFLRLSLLAVFLMFVVLVYAGYQLVHHHYLSFFPSIVLALICVAIAFRYHFWYFQIKTAQLGCTFNDWLDYMTLGKKQ